jgi:hypothetical protein
MLRFLKNIFKFLGYLIGTLLFIFFTYLCIGYFRAEVYDFPEPEKFSGDRLYNPYENLNPRWYKGNFHAHSYAWGGLTNGKQSEEEVIQKYKSEGFDIIQLSNYHEIFVTDATNIPVYEHGYSTTKTHRLVFGAESPSYFDIPIYINTSAKQWMLNNLRDESKMLVIAHPAFANGHTPEELKYITGYDLIEVLNHYRISDVHWDSALTSGRAVWLLSNDDTHDINDPVETGVSWTLINAPDKTPDNIMLALKTGKAIGLKGKNFENPFMLENVKVNDMTVSFKFKTPGNITLVGDGRTIKTQAENSDSISYTMKPEDTYLRAVQITPDSVSFLYTNPVIRYSGESIPSNPYKAQINYFKTYLIRFIILIPYGLLIFFIVRRYKKRRRTIY